MNFKKILLLSVVDLNSNAVQRLGFQKLLFWELKFSAYSNSAIWYMNLLRIVTFLQYTYFESVLLFAESIICFVRMSIKSSRNLFRCG